MRCTETLSCREHENRDIAFCKASTHQGDAAAFNHSSVGRQCLPNCLIACTVTAVQKPSTWTTDTMDYILHEGDNLYQHIDAGHDFLLPTDLPTCVHVCNKIFNVVRGKEAFGTFTQNLHKTRNMLSVLCTFIQTTATSALICLGDQSGSSAITVLSQDTSMYIFDPHSRNISGMPSAHGTAVLMRFNNIPSTVSFICELADSLAARLFHWTFWHSVTAASCDCDIFLGKRSPSIDVLSEAQIMNLYSELVQSESQPSNRRNYYKSYRKRVRESETPDQTHKRRKCDRHYKASARQTETYEETACRREHNRQCKNTSRAQETPQQTKKRQEMAKMNISQTRLAKKTKVETIDDAMNNFKSEVKKQPVYICTSCHRLLWRKGVQKFSIDKYNKVRPEIIQLVLDDKYRLSSIDGSTYICHCCHRTLKLGRIPAQSKANRMELEEIPDQLRDLNNLELHIICKRILFMKLVKLPRGKQKGIRGAAVNVPADLGPACTLLPRLPADAHIVSLKLKRKLEYKQAYLHDVIRPEKVISALHYLKNNNPLYADIEINEDWIRGWQDGDNDMYDGIFVDENDKAEASNHKQMPDINCNNVPLDNIDDSDCDSNESVSDKTQQDNSNEIEKEDLIALEENCKLRDLPYDTCLQSELPEEANQVFSIAPGEGNKPIPLLTDTLFEELANPDKFPFGKGGFVDTERDTKLTLRKYVNARLLDQDGRFAKDIEYIFAMQYAVEHKQVRDSISIALRQTRGRQQVSRNLHAGMLKNPQHLQNLFKKDRAYTFLKNIRGSPPYWQKMFYELLAMIRTLGIPTWFLTLSAADMKWPEVIQSIAKQYGTIYTEQEVLELPWRLKSMWLRSNPVTPARMFQYRLDAFVITFLKSSAQPIGEVIEYVIRIEFQARGSPHAHTLIWIKDAPKLGYADEADVKAFIDKYISCSLPDDDQELRALVEGLQIHRHSPTCRRKGSCRFNYPKPPSPHTIISDEPQENCQQQIDFAVKNLTAVKQVLESKDLSTDITLQEVLNRAHVTLDDYTKSLSISKCGRSVILKRKPSEQSVNYYSPAVLKAWEANMDIQYVVNAYACVMYIASYVLKAEKGMGELLKQAAREMEQGNTRQQLNKLGSVFLTNREVSAQEAVYRVLSIPLRRCSRSVVFINTDNKESRDALLLPFSQLQNLDDDNEDVYCKNIIDRYAARPKHCEDMCLAQFAASYTYNRHISQDENEFAHELDSDIPDDSDEITHTNVIKLQNGLGQMKKRKRKAVIRWHNFNIEKEPEKHYRSRIMLFLPWRREEKLRGNYMSYEDRYNDEIERIKATEKMFIHQEDEINSAFEHLQAAGPPQAAWDNIAPGAEEAEELAHQEGISDERPMAEEDIQHHINQIVNDWPQSHNESLNTKYTKEARKELLSPREYNKCMRQLNTEQKTMVMYHRKWCKETVIALKQHKPVKPYHVFLSGSGGVGKSYVVKMLHTDTVKLLQCSQQIKPEDVPILLTAATGVAAHNINGITVHSAFMLNDRKKAGTTYYNLSSDTLSTLQTHLEQLMVVIIDEISMIGAQTLYKIHMRLQEIKGLHYSNTRFGNVTIIAVGDLYQLPPLKDKKIYDTPGTGDDPNPICLHQSLWKENFYFHELKHVVRQKNKQFAQLLNRVREAKITEHDETTLKGRVTTLDHPDHFTDALHVYGTNQQADQYNAAMLQKLDTPKYVIQSSDITRDRETRQLKISLDGKKRTDTGGLPSQLTIAENAYVRLTSNIDVADGLANGVRGIIQKIIINEDGAVNTILVKFDNEGIGQKAKASSPYNRTYGDAIPIYRHGVSFQHRNITIFRSQFPLVLSWASTIHSVQGLTVDKIVVDLSKIFAAGQAYVALSRVTSLEGLQILNYNSAAIKKDKRVDTEMLRLQQRPITFVSPIIPTLPEQDFIKISHLNVRGYLDHIDNLKTDHVISSADVICLTETHLRKSDTIHLNSQPIKSHVQYRADRVGGVQKGGILIFVNRQIPSTRLNIQIPGLEFLATSLSPNPNTKIVLITLYRRSSTVSTQEFIAMVEQLLSSTALLHAEVLVVSDFNDDLMGNTTKISSWFERNGFNQLIDQPTTDQGSLLDHVYFNGVSPIQTEVCDTYYSDHDCTIIAIPNTRSQS